MVVLKKMNSLGIQGIQIIVPPMVQCCIVFVMRIFIDQAQKGFI